MKIYGKSNIIQKVESKIKGFEPKMVLKTKLA